MRDSISARVSRAVTENMSDGAERSISEIKDLIELTDGLKHGIDYQESHLTGVIGRLKRQGILEPAGRGIYKAKREAEEKDGKYREEEGEKAAAPDGSLRQMKWDIMKEFEKNYQQLVKRVDSISVGPLSKLSLRDVADLQQLLEMKEDIRKILGKYMKM